MSPIQKALATRIAKSSALRNRPAEVAKRIEAKRRADAIAKEVQASLEANRRRDAVQAAMKAANAKPPTCERDRVLAEIARERLMVR